MKHKADPTKEMKRRYTSGRRGQAGWSSVLEYEDGSMDIQLIEEPNVVGAMFRSLTYAGKSLDQVVAEWQAVNGRLL